jgi:hypothetical protein
MFTYTPTLNDNFAELAQGLLRQRTGLLEDEILSFWREYEPNKIDQLLFQKKLRAVLRQQASALTDMQEALEKQEQLPPPLAKMEAWRRLMRIEEDEAEEAAAWGMTLDEYRNRSWGMD